MANDDPTMVMPDDDRPTDFFVEVEVIGQIDRYHLIRLLGSGAFGAVYLAWDSVAEIQVAIKSLPRVVARHTEALERARRNFSLVAKLSHPNITTLRHLHKAVDVDEDAKEFVDIKPGDYLIVMDVADGSTLNKTRRDAPDGRLSVAHALDICRQVATALDYAHGQNIIHRDVKPGNIIANANRHTEVLDFGLAASIEESVAKYSRELQKICGTRQYMAPEQWAGTQQSQATDQYALAVVFYELVSGRAPFADVFASEDRDEIIDVVLLDKVPPVKQLSRRQNRVLRRALAKNPEERYSNCTAVVDELAGVARRQSSGTGPLVALAAIVVAMLVASIVVLKPDWVVGRPADAKPDQPKQPVAIPVPDAIVELQGQAAVLRKRVEDIDRKQDLGEEVDAAVLALEKGNAHVRNRQFDLAESQLKGALERLQKLLEKSEVQAQAASIRRRVRRQRQRAGEAKAAKLATDPWEKANSLIGEAEKLFADGNFVEAEDRFGKAGTAFDQAIKATKRHAELLGAREEWEELADEGIGILQEYGGEAWDELTFLIRVAARLEAEADYAQALKNYRTAIAGLPKVVEQARETRARAKRVEDWQEQFADARELIADATAIETVFARRKERVKLCERAGQLLVRLVKAEALAGQNLELAEDLLDKVKADLGAVRNGPKDLFPWKLDLSEDTDLELAFLPVGDFQIGSTEEEHNWVETHTGKLPVNEGEEPRNAKINSLFWMGRTEVTIAQFRRFIKDSKYQTAAEKQGWAWAWSVASSEWEKRKQASWKSPGYPYAVQDSFPVTCCSWKDAIAFCHWLTSRERKAGRLTKDQEYRLPTEVEWEYACRANQKGRPRFWWGNDWEDAKEKANVRDATPLTAEDTVTWDDAEEWEDKWSFVSPADHFGKAGRNPFGLADMLGNVAEWILDGYVEKQAEPSFQTTIADKRVLRGGSFQNGAAKLRNAARSAADPSAARQDIGFRIVCAPIIRIDE